MSWSRLGGRQKGNAWAGHGRKLRQLQRATLEVEQRMHGRYIRYLLFRLAGISVNQKVCSLCSQTPTFHTATATMLQIFY